MICGKPLDHPGAPSGLALPVQNVTADLPIEQDLGRVDGPGEFAGWVVGIAMVSHWWIVLNTGPDGAVLIRCGSVPMFEGKIGRRKNRIAVRIEREVIRQREGDHS